jgi:modulator of FtsH protease HflK
MSTLLLTPPETASKVARTATRRGMYRLRWWLPGLWLLCGIYVVAPDQQAVVTTWGAVTSPRVFPGLHYALPWPIGQVYKLKVHQLRRTVIGGDIPDSVLGRIQWLPSEFLSGDQNLLNLRVVVQYSVTEPRDFLFQAEEVDRVVRAAAESELSRRIAHVAVDDILTTQKVAIQNAVLQVLQQFVDHYRAGVVISSINIDRVIPPPEAADAFRDVASARADAFRVANEAQGYGNDLLPRARGEAAQLTEAAQAYKEGKINRALGEAARFRAVANEFARAPGVTSTRAYLEAMEQILPKIRKLVVDSSGNIDLTVIGREDTSGAARK